jgi:hypothetical protein
LFVFFFSASFSIVFLVSSHLNLSLLFSEINCCLDVCIVVSLLVVDSGLMMGAHPE